MVLALVGGSRDSASFEREDAGERAITLGTGTYTVKANLVLAREKYAVASKFFGLAWPEKKTTGFDPALQGWVARDDATYFWAPGEIQNVIDIPLSFNPDLLSITDFDELHIDYQDLFPGNPAHLSLGIALSGVKEPAHDEISENGKGRESHLMVGGEMLVKIGQKKLLKAIDVLDISSTSWLMKDYLYVVKRMIGFPFDAFWHYNQQGVDTFFQRRLHKDLDFVETLDLVFQPDVMPLKINAHERIIEVGNRLFACNLRIGFGNRLKPEEIVPCSSLPLRVIKNLDRQILQVEVGALVRNYRERGKDIVFLNEIIIHLPRRKAPQVAEHPPLEKIVFQEWDRFQKEEWLKSKRQKETIPVITLFSKTEDLSGKSKRLILNLRGLARQVGKNPMVGRISLSIQPDDPEKRSGVHLNRAGIVKLMDDERPLFLGVGERLSRRWGGPFFESGDKDKIEWVKVDAHLSLKNRGWEKARGSISVGNGEVEAGTSSVWRSTSDGLEVEGQGKWMEIDWPVHVRAGEGTRFYLDVSEGVESVIGMRVEPRHGAQTLSAREAFPSVPVETGAGEIDKIKVRLELDGKPFHIVFKEMSLFRPVVLTPAEALDIPQPDETSLPPTSTDASTGAGMRSVHDNLSRYPVIQWNGLRFFYPNNVSAVDLLTNSHWGGLGFLSIESDSEISPSYLPHPYFHVRKVVFEKAGSAGGAGISSIINMGSRQNMEPDPFFGLSRWTKFLFIIFAIMALRWAWRRAYQPRFGSIKTMGDWYSSMQTVLLCLYRQTLPLTMVINRLLGVMVLGFGFWAIQALDDPNPVLWVVVSFLFCVLWHELRERSRSDELSAVLVFIRGRNEEVPYTLRFVALVVIGWVIWQASHRTIGQGVSGIWWPLAFLGCLYLPWLERSITWLWKRPHRLWFGMATGFYVAGLLTTVTRSENYCFTLGSVAVVFAWRSLMLFVQPKLEIKYPALAHRIYAGPGAPYIAGFILVLVGTTLAFLGNLEQVAEQFAVIGYYMLLTGLILEAGVFIGRFRCGREA